MSLPSQSEIENRNYPNKNPQYPPLQNPPQYPNMPPPNNYPPPQPGQKPGIYEKPIPNNQANYPPPPQNMNPPPVQNRPPPIPGNRPPMPVAQPVLIPPPAGVIPPPGVVPVIPQPIYPYGVYPQAYPYPVVGPSSTVLVIPPGYQRDFTGGYSPWGSLADDLDNLF